MASTNSKLGNIILQLHNRTNEAKEAFDQALAELELQKAENEKQYQEQLKQLEEERQQWEEEKIAMEDLVAATSSIVNLNVGGEKMSTSRSTLTLVEGSLLASMFSGKWEEKLTKDTDGCIFLDYDPMLFKHLLNQLRIWSDPTIKRVFHLPVGSEQSFVEFLRLLKFDERFISEETITVTTTLKTVPPEQEIERFRTENNPCIRLTDNDRRCENINGGWYCVFGTLNYSTGIHRLRLKIEQGTTDILIGICSQNKPPGGPFFYNRLNTCGWFTHGYTITHGQASSSGWTRVNENDILELTINCNEQALGIRNERSRVQASMQVNSHHIPFPWCLLILFRPIGSRVALV